MAHRAPVIADFTLWRVTLYNYGFNKYCINMIWIHNNNKKKIVSGMLFSWVTQTYHYVSTRWRKLNIMFQ